MGDLAILLKRPPYGDVSAAEAVRHALGAVSGELSVDLVLVDGGVLLAMKGQDETGTGFTNLEGALRDCIDMGVVVSADDQSLQSRHAAQEEIVEGVQTVDGAAIAKLVKEAKTTMIF